MNNGIAGLLLGPIVLATLIALFSVMRVLFPNQVAGAKAAAADMPGRSFALGTVNLLFVGVVAASFGALGNALGGVFQLLALILLGLLTGSLAFGLAGMSLLVGERLLPAATPSRQAGWGAAAMGLACLTPFLGWFGLFPYLAILGLGAFLIGLFRRPTSSL